DTLSGARGDEGRNIISVLESLGTAISLHFRAPRRPVEKFVCPIACAVDHRDTLTTRYLQHGHEVAHCLPPRLPAAARKASDRVEDRFGTIAHEVEVEVDDEKRRTVPKSPLEAVPRRPKDGSISVCQEGIPHARHATSISAVSRRRRSHAVPAHRV